MLGCCCRVDADDYDGHQTLVTEGLAPSISVFLVRSFEPYGFLPLKLRIVVESACAAAAHVDHHLQHITFLSSAGTQTDEAIHCVMTKTSDCFLGN